MKGFSSFRRIIYESIKQQAMAEQTAVHANRTVKEEMRMRKYVSSLRIYNCKKSGNGYVFKLRDSQGEKVTYRFNTKNRILGCYQDNDKDGVCDFYHQGRYYVDENDNGICDHYENGESGQGWRNNGAGARQAGHHSGSGYGHHAGGGRGGHHHGW